MSTYFEWIQSMLPERRDTSTKLVEVSYAKRVSDEGRGAGMMGINDWMLESYIDGIDATVDLLGNRLKWSPPAPSQKTGRVLALVFDVGAHWKFDMPFTAYYDEEGYKSIIALQSELWETTVDSAKQRARIIGAHEAAHLYTHVHKQLDDPAYDDWAWFDEATAVFIEWTLNDQSPERHRFARTWTLRPEIGLEQRGIGVGYESAWFVEYLVRKQGWDILKDIWQEHKPEESPIQTIDRWFSERGKLFRSASHDVADEFANGYCVQSFLTQGLHPELHERFGNRWHCCTIKLSPGKKESHEGDVEPMACQYWMVRPGARDSRFRVEVSSERAPQQSGLKAYVFAVRDHQILGSPQVLIPSGSPTSLTLLGTTITPVGGADYYVITVANVLCRTDQVGNPAPRGPAAQVAMPNTTAYRLHVSA